MKKILYLLFLLSTNLVYAQDLLEDKSQMHFIIGAELNALKPITDIDYQDELIDNINHNYKLELNTKHFDLGYLYMKNCSSREYQNIELSDDKESQELYIDIKVPRIIRSIRKKQNSNPNYFFVRYSYNTVNRNRMSYEPVQIIAQKHINSAGDAVAPNTPGSIPYFDPFGNPVMITYSTDGNPDYYDVVDHKDGYKKYSIGIGYSYSRSFYNLKSAILYSDIKLDVNHENITSSPNSSAFEFQISFGININSLINSSRY